MDMVTGSAFAVAAAFFLKAKGARVVVVFFAIFFLIGLGLMRNGWGELSLSLAARSWPEVPGMVVKTELLSRRSTTDASTSYAPRVVYQYTYEGQTHLSHRIWIGELWGPRSWASRVLERYPEGQVIAVHVNPSRPEEAVLEPGLRFAALLPFLAGGLFFLIGLGGMIGVAFVASGKEKAPSSRIGNLKSAPGWFLLVFGAIWCLLSLPMAIEAYHQIRQGTWDLPTAVWLAFAIIGVLMVLWGTALILQARPLRKLHIDVLGEPRVGERVCLHLQGLPTQGVSRVYVTLSCTRHLQWYEAGEVETLQIPVWSEEKVLDRTALQRSVRGAFAEVCFQPPARLPPTAWGEMASDADLPEPERRFLAASRSKRVYEAVLWTVEVHLDRKGPDAAIALPIQLLPPREAGTETKAETPEERRPRQFIQPTPEGWIWHPHRYRHFSGGFGSLLGAFIGFLVGGVGSTMFWQSGGWARLLVLLTGFFLLIGLLFLAHALQLWFGGLTVQRTPTEIIFRWTLFGLPLRTRRLKAHLIQRVVLQPPRANGRYVIDIAAGRQSLRFQASFSQEEAQELAEALSP